MDLYQMLAAIVAGFFLVLGTAVFGPVLFIGLVLAALILVTLAAFVSGQNWRAQRRTLAPRFHRTDEVFTDPVTHGVTRVYLDPGTGERRYVPEN